MCALKLYVLHVDKWYFIAKPLVVSNPFRHYKIFYINTDSLVIKKL